MAPGVGRDPAVESRKHPHKLLALAAREPGSVTHVLELAGVVGTEQQRLGMTWHPGVAPDHEIRGHFAPELSAHDLSHLAAFQAACRLCIGGGHGGAFTFATRPLPPASAARAREVRRRSVELYAVTRSEVEAEIRARPPQRRLRAASRAKRPRRAVSRAVSRAAWGPIWRATTTARPQRRRNPRSGKPVTRALPDQTRSIAPRRSGTESLSVFSHLTDRDADICLDIYEHRFLTTPQIFQLHFSSYPRARVRAKELFVLGILNRFRPPQRPGSSPWHYVLDRLGAEIVSGLRDVEADKLYFRKNRPSNLLKSPRLRHMRDLNEGPSRHSLVG